ncbi:MFS transporter [Streptomyces sp. ID05-04B]|uniref:MFS transporter n=1 Tax=unclassified Streptomyces TaxID=2593676 RepID=UPI000D1A8508|nr:MULTISPECIES: MFS transporter [unclassified Streptomyces]AVV44563.1 MFS transporter [Streptomyces sp. P3]MDX5564773.1 MFS transporter [Streptomyces sp. ID05-04B]
MESAEESPTTISTPWGIAPFRRFLSAQLISATGSAMAPLALAYSVIEQGGGPGSLGLVLTTNTVPMIVFLLAGGVFADRLSRSRLLFLGNLLAAGAQGVLALSVATGHATTASIAACGFVAGTAASFAGPAAQGAVAQIVPAEHLQQANALLRLPTNAVKVLAPVVGGFVVAASGAAWALAWDAFTFAAAAVLLLGLRLDAPLTRSGSALADLRAGWTSFWSRTWLWTYTAAGTVLVAAWLAGFQLLGPLVAVSQYAGARDWGLIQAAFASGLLAGTVVCLRWKPYRLLMVAVAAGGALVLPLAAMAWGLPLPVVLGAALLAGIGLDVAVVAWTTVFQQHVPQAEQGRLIAFNGIGERLAIPVGYLVTALAAHSFDGRTVLLACAAMIAAATVLNLCVPAVHRVNRLTPVDRPTTNDRREVEQT